jgi:hypothetical protein
MNADGQSNPIVGPRRVPVRYVLAAAGVEVGTDSGNEIRIDCPFGCIGEYAMNEKSKAQRAAHRSVEREAAKQGLRFINAKVFVVFSEVSETAGTVCVCGTREAAERYAISIAGCTTRIKILERMVSARLTPSDWMEPLKDEEVKGRLC